VITLTHPPLELGKEKDIGEDPPLAAGLRRMKPRKIQTIEREGMGEVEKKGRSGKRRFFHFDPNSGKTHMIWSDLLWLGR